MLQRIARLAQVPNAPFLYSPALRVICQEIEVVGSNEVKLAQDEFALYARLYRGHSCHPLVLISHLDHPGIVLKGNQGGICLGTVGYERLDRLLKENSIPLRIFDSDGENEQKGQVSKFFFDWGVPWVEIEAEREVKRNSHGLWDVTSFEVIGDKIRMFAADNIVPSAVALEVLQKVVESPLDFENIDVTLIFTYVEEVHQICATGIAQRGSTPFGLITEDSIVIALEAMEAISPSDLPEVFAIPNYQDGVLIKINDDRVLFGQGFPNEPNLAENLLLQAAQEAKLLYQHTLTGGSTDAKAFSLEGVSPSIATLSIPNQYKHNIGENKEIIAEEVLQRDIEAAVDILTRAIFLAQEGVNPKHPTSLALKLKSANYGLTAKEHERLARQRRQTMKYYLPRLKTAHFFPESPGEWFNFHLARVRAKLGS